MIQNFRFQLFQLIAKGKKKNILLEFIFYKIINY